MRSSGVQGWDEDSELTGRRINDGLETIIKGLGLKASRQNFTYRSAGREYSGENLYAILQAPRGDATEAGGDHLLRILHEGE